MRHERCTGIAQQLYSAVLHTASTSSQNQIQVGPNSIKMSRVSANIYDAFYKHDTILAQI